MKPSPLLVQNEIRASADAFSPGKGEDTTFDFMKYPNLAMKNNFMLLIFSPDQLAQPLVSLPNEPERKLALDFNSCLYKICEGDHVSDF